YFIAAGGEGIESVQVTKVGRTYPFSITQEQFSIEGRGLVREATLEGYRENSEFAKKVPGEEELPHPPPTIYTHPPLTAPQQWGMSIDMNVCTGCSACVIACQAENNVPVVGKLQVSHGRIMHWLRIDRYYASRKPYSQEPVGKRNVVGALNIYEEYFAPLTTKGAPDTIKMQKNPNVTVRMRGVMEKCTFCVQRIEEAKIAALARAGASPDTRIPRDSFTTACAQACPTEAIVFGDIKDPESRVSKMKQQDRNYRILDYLNVVPRVSYLARIRNPNPKMPDAQNIGVASFEEKSA